MIYPENAPTLPAQTKLEMVDLKRQYQRLKPEFDQALASVIAATAFINGPDVKLFSDSLSQYLGGAQVIPCANGTDALQLVLMAFNFPAGAEVLVPAFNYVAAAETVAFMGLKPVFVDVEPGTFNLDVESASRAITPQTVAIMAVHLFGQCANMEAILQLAEKHQLKVIEDNAQAIGATYKGQQAGTLGNVGTTSFFPSKNLGCWGDGGAIYTHDTTLAAHLRMLANHGQAKKYTYEKVGINSRLDTLQAAVLRVKLPHLDDFTARRQAAAHYYDQHLAQIPGLQVPIRNPDSTHVFHQYCILLPVGKDRNQVQEELKQMGVPTMVYYPSPLHLQQAFAYLGYQQGSFPVAEGLCKRILALPIHTEFAQGEQAYIVAALKQILP